MTKHSEADAIEMITSEGLMRWDWSAMTTVGHVEVARGCAHFAEAFKGYSDDDALRIVQDFLKSTAAKPYMQRRCVWLA